MENNPKLRRRSASDVGKSKESIKRAFRIYWANDNHMYWTFLLDETNTVGDVTEGLKSKIPSAGNHLCYLYKRTKGNFGRWKDRRLSNEDNVWEIVDKRRSNNKSDPMFVLKKKKSTPSNSSSITKKSSTTNVFENISGSNSNNNSSSQTTSGSDNTSPLSNSGEIINSNSSSASNSTPSSPISHPVNNNHNINNITPSPSSPMVPIHHQHHKIINSKSSSNNNLKSTTEIYINNPNNSNNNNNTHYSNPINIIQSDQFNLIDSNGTLNSTTSSGRPLSSSFIPGSVNNSNVRSGDYFNFKPISGSPSTSSPSALEKQHQQIQQQIQQQQQVNQQIQQQQHKLTSIDNNTNNNNIINNNNNNNTNNNNTNNNTNNNSSNNNNTFGNIPQIKTPSPMNNSIGSLNSSNNNNNNRSASPFSKKPDYRKNNRLSVQDPSKDIMRLMRFYFGENNNNSVDSNSSLGSNNSGGGSDQGRGRFFTIAVHKETTAKDVCLSVEQKLQLPATSIFVALILPGNNGSKIERILGEDEIIITVKDTWEDPSQTFFQVKEYPQKPINKRLSRQIHSNEPNVIPSEWRRSTDAISLRASSEDLWKRKSIPILLQISPANNSPQRHISGSPLANIGNSMNAYAGGHHHNAQNGGAGQLTTTNQHANQNTADSDESDDEAEFDISSLKGWVHWIPSADLEYIKRIGSGTYSKVYKGRYKDKFVAIKTMRGSNMTTEQIESFKKECDILSTIQSPFLISFYGSCIEESQLSMVVEYCSKGTLHKVLNSPQLDFDWEKWFKWMCQVVEGVNYLHDMKPPMVHRDLKTLNILVSSDFNAKLCDFGLTRTMTMTNVSTLGMLRGTMAYTAPEIYDGLLFNTKSDVYSLGVIMWEAVQRCLSGSYLRPFHEHPISIDIQIIILTSKNNIRPKIIESCPEELKQLITRCWDANPDKRPNCEEILSILNNLKLNYDQDREAWESLRVKPQPKISKLSSGPSSTDLQPQPQSQPQSQPKEQPQEQPPNQNHIQIQITKPLISEDETLSPMINNIETISTPNTPPIITITEKSEIIHKTSNSILKSKPVTTVDQNPLITEVFDFEERSDSPVLNNNNNNNSNNIQNNIVSNTINLNNIDDNEIENICNSIISQKSIEMPSIQFDEKKDQSINKSSCINTTNQNSLQQSPSINTIIINNTIDNVNNTSNLFINNNVNVPKEEPTTTN